MSAPTPPIVSQDTPFVRPTLTRLYWRDPVSSGSSPISSYTVTCPAISFSQSVPYPERNLTVTGLTDGVEYVFRVSATNTDGLSSSEAIYYPLQTGAPPSPPLDLSYSTLTSNAVLFQWSTPTNIGGSALTYNAVWIYPMDGQSNILSNLTASTVKEYANGYENSNLIYMSNTSVSYKYIVRAINSCDWSSDAANLYQILSFSGPGPSVPTVDSNGLRIRFDAPLYTGSGPWSNLATTGASYDATLAAGSSALNAASNGIVLNGSSYWTFSNPVLNDAFTAFVWYKPLTTPTSGPSTMAKILRDTTSQYNLFMGYSFSSNIKGGFSPGAYSVSGSNMDSIDNTWACYAVTWDGANNTLTTFFNGSNIGTTSSSDTASTTSSNPYYIGADLGWSGVGPGAFVNGEIGQILLYNRPLTDGEILSNYNNTSNIYV